MTRPRPLAARAAAALRGAAALALSGAAGSFAAALIALGAASSSAAAQAMPSPVAFADPAAWRAAPADGVALRLVAGAPGEICLDFDFRGRGGYAAARRPLPLDLPANYAFSFTLRGAGPSNTLEFKLVDPSGDDVWWVRREEVVPGAPRRMVFKKRHVQFAWGPSRAPLTKLGAVEFAVTAGTGGKGRLCVGDFAFEARPEERPYAGVPKVSASSELPGFEASRLVAAPVAAREAAAPVAAPEAAAPVVAPEAAAPVVAREAAAPVAATPAAAWRAGADDAAPWVAFDFGEPREFGGLTVAWEDGRAPLDFDVDLSADGTNWTTAREARGFRGGLFVAALPEAEARFLRLRTLRGGAGCGIARLAVEPLEFAPTPSAFFARVAAAARRGDYPRAYLGEQNYWTVVSVDGGLEKGLFDEDGRVEPAKGSFSLEPFVVAGGRVFSWADVQSTPRLEDGSLPLPATTWLGDGFTLDVAAAAVGAADSSALVVRYRLANTSSERRALRLALAARPHQVNPPAQFLGKPGGVAPIGSARWDGRALLLDGAPRVLPLAPPTRVFALTFDEGNVPEALRDATAGAASPGPAVRGAAASGSAGRGAAAPERSAVDDPQRLAEAALLYEFDLPAGSEAEVAVALPQETRRDGWPKELRAAARGPWPRRPRGLVARLRETAAADWRAKLGGVAIVGPESARPYHDALRANLGFILAARRGPALRPGARSYDRSWIRDGAMMADALLRTGRRDAARDFAAWYAPYLYDDGKTPCCVDARGADPVPENDADGEFVHLVAAYVRASGDVAFGARMWPSVAAAAGHIDALRARRRGPEWRSGAKEAFFGLLPESISHEGYSEKPMHSFWDDAWGRRGLADAAELAGRLGRKEDAARFAASRDEFGADVVAAIERTIRDHGIDHLPGCAEKGDFDATSSTALLEPGGLRLRLPARETRRTFERYAEEIRARAAGAWDLYTPYEWRSVGAMVRLGMKREALETAAFLMDGRRPAAWGQWAEVVRRDPRKAGFVGDMPHAWVGSDFMRAALDLFAYEREDGALVVAAGLPESWARAAGGAGIRGLFVPGGRLSFAASAKSASAGCAAARGAARPSSPDRAALEETRADEARAEAACEDEARVRIEAGLTPPAAGLVVHSPIDGRPLRAFVDGREAPLDADGAVAVRAVPAEVVFVHAAR